jgi:hypothetical protein
MTALEHDPFFRKFLARVPGDVAATFSDSQLDAVKRAFGARTPGSHTVDLRFSLPLGRRRFYIVLLAGRERRSSRRLIWERAMRPLWTAANAVVMSLFALALCASLFTVLYAGKRAAGIDIVPGVDMLPDAKVERLLR